MTSEAGYITKAVSLQHSERVPSSTLPEYHYHEHANHLHLPHLDEHNYHQFTTKSFSHSSPAYYHGQSYSGGGVQQPSEHHLHGLSLYAGPCESVEMTREEGEESESSPEYESSEDLSSVDIPSTHRASHSSVSQPMSLDDTVRVRHKQLAHTLTTFGTATQGGGVPTAVGFQLVKDCGMHRSQSLPAALARRHSDVSTRHSFVLRANAPCAPMLADGHAGDFLAPKGHEGFSMEKPMDSSTQSLHPYVSYEHYYALVSLTSRFSRS